MRQSTHQREPRWQLGEQGEAKAYMKPAKTPWSMSDEDEKPHHKIRLRSVLIGAIAPVAPA